VRLNAVCDVPLAAFLSGGLDSSIVVAEASQGRATPLDTLSIDFGEHSEEDAARASCAARVFGCRHHPYRVAPSELRALALGCLDAMDHPLGARDAAATFALARRLARELPGTKVVLTGTGADELFAGYGSAYFGPRAGSVEEQCAAYVASYACTSPSAWRALGDVVPAPLPVARVAGEVAQRVRRLGPALSAADPANVLCAFYLVGHLPGWELATQDAMCMASSIEPRVPFLGRRVVELAMATSGHRKRAGGREKAVLRDAYAGRLPEPIRTRPKVPLSRPVAAWLCAHGIRDLYLRSGFRDRGLLRVERLRSPEVLSEFDVMWRLMALERWLQRNFD
jgi:asparagine synthase (glutamine-hydrolysing)